jgi:ABC-2 type transport system ATP-binding protein
MSVLVTTHYMEEADQHCDRVALMHRGQVRAVGTPGELKAALSPAATLDDVFRHWSGDDLALGEVFGDVRATRRTAGRVG